MDALFDHHLPTGPHLSPGHPQPASTAQDPNPQLAHPGSSSRQDPRTRHDKRVAIARGTAGTPLERIPLTRDSELPTYSPREDLLDVAFRHSWWAARRSRVRAALHAALVSRSRIARFNDCGGDAWIFRHRTTGQVKLASQHCRDRFCQACGRERALRIQWALRERVPLAKCLHVVLTMRSRPEPLRRQLDRIYAAAARLRATSWWRSRVTGGSMTLELTRNDQTGLWHPHVHLLVHADWLAQSELCDQWHRVTGDSRIVHVSLVRADDSAIREVTKYLGAPVHRSVDCRPEHMVELIEALRGRHLITTFGTWRRDPLLSRDRPPDDGEWERLASLSSMRHRAAAGDEYAQELLRYLASMQGSHRDARAWPAIRSDPMYVLPRSGDP